MSDERRPMMDESQVTNLLRSYIDTGVRPFDPGAIAARAIAAAGGRGSLRWWPSQWSWPAPRVSVLVALGLLLLAAGVVLAGALLRLDQRPVAGFIAVATGGGVGEQIRILDPDGTGETILPSYHHIYYPVWSPDGTRLAYSDHLNRGPVGVVNADGTGTRSISGEYFSGFPVAWSPDGRQVVFLGSHPNGTDDRGVLVANADGNGLVRLLGPDALLHRLAWAPDGSLISGIAGGIAAREGAKRGAVHVVDPRTGEETPVSESPLVPRGDQPYRDSAPPSWSPDSSRLLYSVAGVGGTWDIAVAERTASGWVERLVVPNPTTNDISPLWLDSDRFVFVRDMSRVVVANADGSGEREILREPLFPDAAPCVAPDGSRIAVLVGGHAGTFRGELLVVSVDGATAPVRIPVDSPNDGGPACSWQAVER